jgi:hypothetical protein
MNKTRNFKVMQLTLPHLRASNIALRFLILYINNVFDEITVNRPCYLDLLCFHTLNSSQLDHCLETQPSM